MPAPDYWIQVLPGRFKLRIYPRHVDRILEVRDFETMHWQEFSFTDPHHTWMSRILLFLTWGVLREGKPLPKDVREFVRHSLALTSSLPLLIATDCLHVIYLVLGIRWKGGDCGVTGIRSVGLAQVISRVKLN